MGRCCVPNCRGNYDGGPKVRVFSIPKDGRRAKWIRAIRRDDVDIETLRDPKVCELHFKPEYLRTTTSYTDQNGRTIEVAMNLTRLSQDAVPTIFLNSPSYLSDCAPVREEPESKRKRLEERQLQEAIQLSVESHEDEDRQNRVSSFDQLVSLLPRFPVSDFWVVTKLENSILFLHVDDKSGYPEVERSVTVSRDMKVLAFWKKVKLFGGGVSAPDFLDDLRTLQVVLDSVEHFKAPDACEEDEKREACFQLLFSLLDDISSEGLLPQEKNEALSFMVEQLHLLLKEGGALRYRKYSCDVSNS